MFNLVEMTDTIKIQPWLFNVPLNSAVKVELNRRFANKVIHNVGLCICLFDIIRLEDSFIFPGDGSSHTKVHFRFIVFHPFPDEVLVGKIKGCSQEGVTVSLDFFDDIVIPPEALKQPSKFDDSEQLWVWEFATSEGPHDLFMEINYPIRFRVIEQTFTDTTPSTIAGESNVSGPSKSPYTLKGSITDDGLGMLSWWS